MDDKTHYSEFVYFITERERIRQEKEKGHPVPWSPDKVFQTTYFCNVNREHDRVTRWIRENYDNDYPVLPNMIMARFVNKPESLKWMMWPWPHFYPHVWEQCMSKPGAWGGAYVVSTNGRPLPKHEYIAGLLEQAFERFAGGPGTKVAPTCSGWHAAIQGLQGMGSFMAGQVVADLKNTKGHVLANAEDWSTFAAHGPGSLRGLSWFHGRTIKPKDFTEALVSARQVVHNIDSTVIATLCNQNLQNCFCEFDKYMRVSTGSGRSKRKYNGV